MRHWLAGLVAVGILCVAAAPAGARDYFGAEVGYSSALGRTADFSTSGLALDVRWRHRNRGHSAFEVEVGYQQLGLEGEIQITIAQFDTLVRQKNQLAQTLGGPGEGFLSAEYGILEIYHLDANFVYFLLKESRFDPFLSFGGGVYDWRVPFRLVFRRTPFFGEQHVYDPVPATGSARYAGVVAEEQVDFTKHARSGGLCVAAGLDARLTGRLQLAATARFHLIFSSGTGNREEGIDDQDYLDNMTVLILKGGLTYRF